MCNSLRIMEVGESAIYMYLHVYTDDVYISVQGLGKRKKRYQGTEGFMRLYCMLKMSHIVVCHHQQESTSSCWSTTSCESTYSPVQISTDSSILQTTQSPIILMRDGEILIYSSDSVDLVLFVHHFDVTSFSFSSMCTSS